MTAETPVLLHVVGLPAPKGSKSAQMRGGRAHVIEGASKEQRARLDQWNNAVATAARDWLGLYPRPPFDGPLSIDLLFRFPPTKSSPDRHFHAVEPDGDKIMRATGDALKHAGLIADDKLFARVSIEKRYADVGENIGCTIRLRSLAQIEAVKSAARKAARTGKPVPANAETLL